MVPAGPGSRVAEEGRPSVTESADGHVGGGGRIRRCSDASFSQRSQESLSTTGCRGSDFSFAVKADVRRLLQQQRRKNLREEVCFGEESSDEDGEIGSDVHKTNTDGSADVVSGGSAISNFPGEPAAAATLSTVSLAAKGGREAESTITMENDNPHGSARLQRFRQLRRASVEIGKVAAALTTSSNGATKESHSSPTPEELLRTAVLEAKKAATAYKERITARCRPRCYGTHGEEQASHGTHGGSQISGRPDEKQLLAKRRDEKFGGSCGAFPPRSARGSARSGHPYYSRSGCTIDDGATLTPEQAFLRFQKADNVREK